MEELIKRLERVIQTGTPDKDGMHPISAETVLEVVNELSEHGTNLASLGTDCISREQAIDAIKREKVKVLHELYDEAWNDAINGCMEVIGQLPPIQSDVIRCKDCKHHWTHKCMDSMPIERCDLEQTFYDAEIDFCSLAERRE